MVIFQPEQQSVFVHLHSGERKLKTSAWFFSYLSMNDQRGEQKIVRDTVTACFFLPAPIININSLCAKAFIACMSLQYTMSKCCLWAGLIWLHTWPQFWPCVTIVRHWWFFQGAIVGCVWSCVWFKPPLGWKWSLDRLMAESQPLWDSCVKLSVWWRDNCKVGLTVSLYF